MTRIISSVALCALLSAACGGDEAPADVSGDYTLSITSGANGCNFENWDEGATNTGIPMSLVETGGEATADIGGISALFLNLLVGSNTFTGDVSGQDLSLSIEGSVDHVQGGCTSVVNSELEASIDGDILIGTVIYTVPSGGTGDCGALAGCESIQNFNGTRPPQ